MQKKDPLATQVWKYYSKTKTQLPSHERMENLTWRMMAMNLKRQEREQARYVCHGDGVGVAGAQCESGGIMGNETMGDETMGNG